MNAPHGAGTTEAVHILVVEDEQKTAAYLKKGLTENGFTVDIADDGEEGLNLACNSHYDLIILDVMLPKRDGWSVISELRRSGKQTLSLFLTAKDSVNDRIKGLELGADSYLVKPFSFSELLAQVRSLLRRNPIRAAEVIQIADLELDFIQHRASRGGRKLDLTPKEFSLLTLLARRTGEVLANSHRGTSLGHEFRQRHQRRRSSNSPVTGESRRSFREQTDSYRPRARLRPARGAGLRARYSITGRLTSWQFLSACVLLISASTLLYWSLVKVIHREDEVVLYGRIQTLQAVLQRSNGAIQAAQRRIESEWPQISPQKIYVRLSTVFRKADF